MLVHTFHAAECAYGHEDGCLYGAVVGSNLSRTGIGALRCCLKFKIHAAKIRIITVPANMRAGEFSALESNRTMYLCGALSCV